MLEAVTSLQTSPPPSGRCPAYQIIEDIKDTLKQYRISSDIFKKIIVVTDRTKKSNHVMEYSLFIDDSFNERNDVITNTKNVFH